METITLVVLFAMFSVTVMMLAIFARPETAGAAMKIMEKFLHNMLKWLTP
jgi:hypothetical protein